MSMLIYHSYLPTKDHREELIKDILLNSNHITLNTNIPTHLSLNQTQQSTSPDISTASADLHDCACWQTIHSLTSNHLLLLTTLSIHHKIKTTCYHFTKTITNYQKAIGHHLNNMLMISFPIDPTAKYSFMRQTNIL